MQTVWGAALGFVFPEEIGWGTWTVHARGRIGS
jgi:hypothetical protein